MKYVLITGATSGIGYELARKFAKEKHNIVIVSSNQERLNKVKQTLIKEFSADVLLYEQDLTKAGAAECLYQRLKEDGIHVSILINNAGFGLLGASDEISLKRDEEMLHLNIIALVDLCKLFLSDMYQQGNGKILNVASTGAFQPGPYNSTYYASKSFVLSYSKAIRYEARKKGVQVCTLCPGATKTEFFHREGMETPKFAMSAEKVAVYAYKRLCKNKSVSVPGLLNKLIRILPEKVKMIAVAKMKKQ